MVALNSTCVVVVPMHTFRLERNETHALLNALSKLRGFEFMLLHKSSHSPDRFLESLPIEDSSRRRLRTFAVPDGDLDSVDAYNQLLLRPDFYRIFTAWDYILIFQLDAWILGDDLTSWLSKGYSYIGAPWIRDLGMDTPDTGVGNGGLSLRAVQDMVRILSSRAFRARPVFRWSELARRVKLFKGYEDFPAGRRPSLFLKRLWVFVAMSFGWKNTLRHYVACHVQEDHFFGIYAPHVYPWMRIPGLWEAASFAIETNPRAIHRRLGSASPFGCHAWEKYDKSFWVHAYPNEFQDLE